MMHPPISLPFDFSALRAFLGGFLSLLILAGSVRADAPTAFVDDKPGTTVTRHCCLLEGSGPKSFMALVTSDTMQHYLVLATAKKGVVKNAQLGRHVKVTAKVIESGLPLTRIEILKVQRVKKS